MNKTFIILSILIISGLLLGGAFLFSGVASVDVIEQDGETLEPVISYSHGTKDCEPPEPGYPDNCGGS